MDGNHVLNQVYQAEEASLWAGIAEDGAQSFPSVTDIQGSRERGLVLHELLEEVLTGEVATASQTSLRAPMNLFAC